MNNEEFKRKYFQTLQDLDDECLLIESLPNPELEHFNELMNYYSSLLKKALKR